MRFLIPETVKSSGKPSHSEQTNSQGILDSSFSLGKAAEIFKDKILSAAPNSFTDETETNPLQRVSEILASSAAAIGGKSTATRSQGIQDLLRPFERITGLKTQGFAITQPNAGTNDRITVGFVHPEQPGIFFYNSEASQPLISTFVHEWTHSTSYDAEKKALLDNFLNAAAPSLFPSQVKIYNLGFLDNGYKAEDIRQEFIGIFVSGLLTGSDAYKTSLLFPEAHTLKLRDLARDLWDPANPINPSGLNNNETRPDQTLAIKQETRTSQSPQENPTVEYSDGESADTIESFLNEVKPLLQTENFQLKNSSSVSPLITRHSALGTRHFFFPRSQIPLPYRVRYRPQTHRRTGRTRRILYR